MEITRELGYCSQTSGHHSEGHEVLIQSSLNGNSTPWIQMIVASIRYSSLRSYHGNQEDDAL